jgi:hypothetical protein
MNASKNRLDIRKSSDLAAFLSGMSMNNTLNVVVSIGEGEHAY